MVESDLKFNKIKNKIFLPEFYQKNCFLGGLYCMEKPQMNIKISTMRYIVNESLA